MSHDDSNRCVNQHLVDCGGDKMIMVQSPESQLEIEQPMQADGSPEPSTVISNLSDDIYVNKNRRHRKRLSTITVSDSESEEPSEISGSADPTYIPGQSTLERESSSEDYEDTFNSTL